jgi:hypothetical protein
MADFLRKVLPDYTAERQPKTQVQPSVTQQEISPAVTEKDETSDDADDETIDLCELENHRDSRIHSTVSEKMAIRL